MNLLLLFVSLMWALDMSYEKYLESGYVIDNYCTKSFKILVDRKAFHIDNVFILTCSYPRDYIVLSSNMQALGWNTSIHSVRVLEAKKSSVINYNGVMLCKVLKTDDIDDENAHYKSVLDIDTKPEIRNKLYTRSFDNGFWGESCYASDWKITILKVDLRKW